MIDELRVQEKKLKNQAPDIKVAIQINGFLRANRIIEKSWSNDQRNTIMDVILHGGNQTESAKRLKTTQSTVARRLAASNYITYKDLEGIINRYLKLDTGPKMCVPIRRSIMTGVRANSFHLWQIKEKYIKSA